MSTPAVSGTIGPGEIIMIIKKLIIQKSSIQKPKPFIPFQRFFLFLIPLFILAALLPSCRSRGRTLENIEAFARLYGYVRYFHPSDEAAGIDWDRFAVYGVQRVENAAGRGELKKVLEELFFPLAPAMEIFPSREKYHFDIQRLTPENNDRMKEIAWQHYGVGMSESPGVYFSIRLNRANKIHVGSGMGNLFQGLDAVPYRGKQFLFKASVRAVRGQGRLWFRVDRENKKVGFFDNMDGRPIRVNRWAEYNITGTIDADAQFVVFGAFLSGNGKLLVDDFRLQVRDKAEEPWQPVKLQHPGFERAKAGNVPRSWAVTGMGYAFEVTSKSAGSGKKSFALRSKSIDGPMRLFAQAPGFGEYVQKKLGRGLSCAVPLALRGDGTHTYPRGAQRVLKNLVNGMNARTPEELRADNRNVRLGNVIITWNIFRHFYPYFDVVRVNWDKVLTRALKDAAADTDEEDFLETLQYMVARLEDGHGNVYHPLVNRRAGPPFRAGWAGGQVVVTHSTAPSFRRGDVIVSQDGRPIDDVLIEAIKLISGSPQWKRQRALLRLGWGKRNTRVRFKINRRGQQWEVTTARKRTKPLDTPVRNSVEELEPGIFYVDLGRLNEEQFKETVPRLTGARGIVFDARGYVGFDARTVLGHLCGGRLLSPFWNIPQVIYPDGKKMVFSDSQWWVDPRKPRFTGKFVFLVHGYTVSASETLMSMVKHYKLAKIVGRTTAGANGNVNPFRLPGEYVVTWTGMRVLNQDGSRHHLLGIAPDVPVELTIEGVREGRDQFLEKAVEVLKKDMTEKIEGKKVGG